MYLRDIAAAAADGGGLFELTGVVGMRRADDGDDAELTDIGAALTTPAAAAGVAAAAVGVVAFVANGINDANEYSPFCAPLEDHIV